MGFFLTCVCLVLTYLPPDFLAPALGPYRVLLVLLIVGTLVSVATLATRSVRGLQSPQYFLVLALWGAVVLSHLTHFKLGWAYDGFYYFAPMVVMFFLVNINANSLGRMKVIAALMITCGVIMGVLGILAYHTGYMGNDFLLYPPSDFRTLMGNRVRGLGTLQDPNDFAQYLLVCLALLGFFWKPQQTARNLVLLSPAAMVFLYAIYLTFSRGGLLGLAAIFFVLMYRKGGQILAVAGAGITAALLYGLNFTGGREIALDNTTMGRIIAWGSGIGALLHHPVFGVGFNRFKHDVNDLTAHNSFVLCFAELGFFGYFFWMGLILVTLSGLWYLAKREPEKEEDVLYGGPARSLLAAVLAFLVTGWFLSRTYAETFYILTGLSASLIYARREVFPLEKFRVIRWAPRTVVVQVISVIAVYAAVRLRSL